MKGEKDMRKLGMDFGDSRIGFAISDPLGIFASGIETYKRKSIEQDIAHICSLIEEYNVDTLVVGLPLNMDGTSGDRVERTKEFCAELSKKTAVNIVYSDERLTTVMAEKMLISNNVRREDRKKVIDKVAATVILQNFLDRK